jgi:hypothetical protein
VSLIIFSQVLQQLIEPSYYLFQASLMPVLAITTEPESRDAASWSADIETAKKILSSVTTHSSKASKFLDVLNRLYSSLDEMEGFMETMQQEGGELMGVIYGQMQGASESDQPFVGQADQFSKFGL